MLSRVFARKRDCLYFFIGVFFCLLFASYITYGPTDFLHPPLEYPLRYDGDNLFSLWRIENFKESFAFNSPRVAYPFDSDFADYPDSDKGNFFILKYLAYIFDSPVKARNVYYLLGFVVNFIAAFVVLRLLGLKVLYALCGAIIFDFVPFHMMRIAHISYTWYFTIPIFYYLSYIIFACERKSAPRKYNYGVLLILSLLLGSFGLYYAVFGSIMLLISGLGGSIRNRSIKNFIVSSLYVICIGVVVLANATPTWSHRINYGYNKESVQRSPAEGEIHGFKLTHLLLPRNGHRFSSFASLKHKYLTSTPLNHENVTSSLGILGVCGFMSICTYILIVIARGGGSIQYSHVTLMSLALLLLGYVGSFGTIISFFIRGYIRGWNRISIFLAFMCVYVLFLEMQNVTRRCLNRFNMLKFVEFVLLFFITSFALFDQSSKGDCYYTKDIRNKYVLDKSFIEQIELALPQYSAVYQLPYVVFPETGRIESDIISYGKTIPFFLSKNLRWSHGGLKGWPADVFYRDLSKAPIASQLAVIRQLGFSGIYIDKRGYSDKGQKIINELEKLLGDKPLVRKDNNAVFFRVTPSQNIDWSTYTREQIIKEAYSYLDKSFSLNYTPDSLGKSPIIFSDPNYPPYLKKIEGLSLVEKWGRWSDANLSQTVKFAFDGPLPNRFTLHLKANAFAENNGQLVCVKIGKNNYTMRIRTGNSENLSINLKDGVADTIEFIPYKPQSPLELNMSVDNRKLAIGFIEMSFTVHNEEVLKQ